MSGALPLSGIRVLDLTRVFAGPVAGRVLVDLGADVVKVEPPEGDITRDWGNRVAGISTYFSQQNAGKRNVSVDLNVEGGPETVAELAAVADIVIENFRPGVLAKFGLDWPALSARNPRLIMASISGFGQDGPESQRAAFASVVHAETGVVDQDVDGTPQDVGFGAADVISGLHSVIGLLAALRVRDAEGHGQHLDIGMVDAMVFSSDEIIKSIDGRPHESKRGEVWQTASGPVMLAGGLRWIWRQMSRAHGLVDPTPSDGALEDKLQSRREIVTTYLTGLPSRDAVVAALDGAGLAWGELRKERSVFETPTIAHRGSVATVDDRAGGVREVVRSPYRMSVTDIAEPGSAAHRGEHNHQVLSQWLDSDAASVDRLMADGVLVEDKWAHDLRSNGLRTGGQGR